MLDAHKSSKSTSCQDYKQPSPNVPTNCIIRWIYSCPEYHKEALAYLGFKPVPKQGMLARRTWCLAQEYARQQPRDVDDSVYAAGLYSSIADISIKRRNTASNSVWFMLGVCLCNLHQEEGTARVVGSIMQKLRIERKNYSRSETWITLQQKTLLIGLKEESKGR